MCALCNFPQLTNNFVHYLIIIYNERTPGGRVNFVNLTLLNYAEFHAPLLPASVEEKTSNDAGVGVGMAYHSPSNSLCNMNFPA